MNVMPSTSSTVAASDSELCTSALAGDREAFRQIVDRYQNLVCAITYSALGDLGRSEEIAQETFIAAWQNLSQLNDTAKLKSWLCGIARRMVSNTRRRQSTDVMTRAEAIDPVLAGMATVDSPLEHAIREEEQAILWGVLEKISPTYREPLVLYYRGQHSVAEVATTLELTEDAVKQRLTRGRKLLKVEVAAFVEKTLRQTRPGTAFAAAVLAALPAATPPAAAAGLIAAQGAGAKIASAAGISLAASGAIVGTLLGLLGAGFGVMAGVTGARTPRERRFMLQFVLATLGLVAVLLGTQRVGYTYFVDTYRTLGFQLSFWGVHLVSLTLLITWGIRRAIQIRHEDGTTTPSGGSLGELSVVPLRSLQWSLAGIMYASVCWIGVFGIPAGDWIAPAVTFLLVAFAWRRIGNWLRAADTLERRILAMLAAMIAASTIGLVVGAIRWTTWQVVPGSVAQRFPLWVVCALILLLNVGSGIHLLVWLRRARREFDGPIDPQKR